jgi:hypothetical protein
MWAEQELPMSLARTLAFTLVTVSSAAATADPRLVEFDDIPGVAEIDWTFSRPEGTKTLKVAAEITADKMKLAIPAWGDSSKQLSEGWNHDANELRVVGGVVVYVGASIALERTRREIWFVYEAMRVEYSQVASEPVLAERWICDERARKVCTPPQWASIKAVKARALKSKSPSPK